MLMINSRRGVGNEEANKGNSKVVSILKPRLMKAGRYDKLAAEKPQLMEGCN